MSNQNQNINQEKFDQFVEKLYSMGYGPELYEKRHQLTLIPLENQDSCYFEGVDESSFCWCNKVTIFCMILIK